MSDPFDLARFVDAQGRLYATALAELRDGHKESHWIWFIFPQLRGLGRSDQSDFYGIGTTAEAKAYLSHPLLGARLVECVRAVSEHRNASARTILGAIDATKFRSSLTLFATVAPERQEFSSALAQFFRGERCERTIEMLSGDQAHRR